MRSTNIRVELKEQTRDREIPKDQQLWETISTPRPENTREESYWQNLTTAVAESERLFNKTYDFREKNGKLPAMGEPGKKFLYHFYHPLIFWPFHSLFEHIRN